MFTTEDISEMLDDKFSAVFNVEQTHDTNSTHNPASNADLINLTLEGDEDDTLRVQVDDLSPIEFDVSDTNMLRCQLHSAFEKRLEDASTTMKEEPLESDANTTGENTGGCIRQTTKHVNGAAFEIMPEDTADKQCTAYGVTGYTGSRAVGIGALQLDSTQDLNGFRPASCICAASDSMSSSTQPAPRTKAQNNSCPQRAHLNMVSPEPIPQAMSPAPCSALSKSPTRPMATLLPLSKFPINYTSETFSKLIDAPRHLASENITPLTKTIRKPKTWENSCRNRYSKGATPSRYCHICGRNSRIEFGQCNNFKLGLCRKVICEKCLILYEPNSRDYALNPNSDWECTHCRQECPERARCKQYTQNNQRRRDKKAREREERQRASQMRKTDVAREAATSYAYGGITDIGQSHLVECIQEQPFGQIASTTHPLTASSAPTQIAQFTSHSLSDDGSQIATMRTSSTRFGDSMFQSSIDCLTAAPTLPLMSSPRKGEGSVKQVIPSVQAPQTCMAEPHAHNLREYSTQHIPGHSTEFVRLQQSTDEYNVHNTFYSEDGVDKHTHTSGNITKVHKNNLEMKQKAKPAHAQTVTAGGAGNPDVTAEPYAQALQIIHEHKRKASVQKYHGRVDRRVTAHMPEQGEFAEPHSVNGIFTVGSSSDCLPIQNLELGGRQMEEVARGRLEMSPMANASMQTKRLMEYRISRRNPDVQKMTSVRQSLARLLDHSADEKTTDLNETNPVEPDEFASHELQHDFEDRLEKQEVVEKELEDVIMRPQCSEPKDVVSPTAIWEAASGRCENPKKQLERVPDR